jgi:glycosyltransferase involved in cell wall biosynthesis
MDNEMAKQVWIIIPAFNEDKAIGDVLADLAQYGYNVVLVDDGSAVPLSVAILQDNMFICRHPINVGQGASLQTGIQFALLKGASYLVTFDADGQHSSSEISRMLEPIVRGECDITLGSRFLKEGKTYNMPFAKYITLKVAVAFTKLTTGLNLTDTHNGFRAMRADVGANLNITQNRMAHASQILNRIKDNQWRFKEIPVTIRYTSYSLNKGQKISNSFNILWESIGEKLQ